MHSSIETVETFLSRLCFLTGRVAGETVEALATSGEARREEVLWIEGRFSRGSSFGLDLLINGVNVGSVPLLSRGGGMLISGNSS